MNRFKTIHNQMFDIIKYLAILILVIVIISLQNDVKKLNNELNYVKIQLEDDMNQVKRRFDFLDEYTRDKLIKLSMSYEEVEIVANTAYEIAYGEISKDSWMIGLTTFEIDSIMYVLNR